MCFMMDVILRFRSISFFIGCKLIKALGGVIKTVPLTRRKASEAESAALADRPAWWARVGTCTRTSGEYLKQGLLMTFPLLLFLFFCYHRCHTPFFFLKKFLKRIKYLTFSYLWFYTSDFLCERHTTQPIETMPSKKKIACSSLFPSFILILNNLPS